MTVDNVGTDLIQSGVKGFGASPAMNRIDRSLDPVQRTSSADIGAQRKVLGIFRGNVCFVGRRERHDIDSLGTKRLHVVKHYTLTATTQIVVVIRHQDFH